MNLIARMDARFYPNHGNYWDNAEFRKYVLKAITKRDTVLDIGAGAGIVQELNFKSHAAKVCGVDPDERIAGNPYLDEAKIGYGEKIPYPDSSFDYVISANVLEHLPDPERFFSEVGRVLKPGGKFLFKTPNKHHYVAQIARLTPHAFHEWINRKRGRDEEDTFPTLYRANTREAVTRAARAGKLIIERISLMEARPEYLRISPLTYILGIAYERLVNAFSCLEPFRVILLGTLKKGK